jgi:hypothetical protein
LIGFEGLQEILDICVEKIKEITEENKALSLEVSLLRTQVTRSSMGRVTTHLSEQQLDERLDLQNNMAFEKRREPFVYSHREKHGFSLRNCLLFKN